MYIAESQGLPFFYSCSLLVNRHKNTSFYVILLTRKQAKRQSTYVEHRFLLQKILVLYLLKYDILQINRAVEYDILQVEVPFEYDNLALYRNSSNLCPSPLLGYVPLS